MKIMQIIIVDSLHVVTINQTCNGNSKHARKNLHLIPAFPGR